MIYKLFGGPEDGREISLSDDPWVSEIVILQENKPVCLLSKPDLDPRLRPILAVYEKGEIGDAHFVGWKGGD